MDVECLTPEDRMRATGEVCCLLNCDHFAIIKCYEDFVLKDPKNPENVLVIALVLDYANAGDLRKEIRNRSRTARPFAEHEAGLLFIQILLAIHHVHSKRMIHRDIKSANILLCSNGLVKLGDFGFSRMYAATVSDDVGRTFCGTPYYVAPEIWRRRPYSKKADMFSLGVLLYELLTLKRPFDGATVEEVMRNTVAGKYEPLPRSVSEDMQSLVAALLNSEPKKRPSSKKLLNTPICKLYLSVVQEIVQNGTEADFSKDQIVAITNQLRGTKEELQKERRRSVLPIEDVMKAAPTLRLPDSSAPGYLLYSGMLKKQGSDLEWKQRFVCIYGEVVAPNGVNEFGTLDLLQAVSRESLDQQCVAVPFADLEDVFPVISKYTGSNAAFAFVVAFKSGKRILFDTDTEASRDEWMHVIQVYLGIGEEE
ncbi:protein kinase [Strigomonas culicis]|uniref:non-specific serine/threonine protein kinase n=1 Tax=Strigomonas culicis TaxID=28005 RepID=S9W1L7_9TRYP|nr:protein kinase [Strigomonas culicis]|eukprot:EPY29660.1 protein kinase [Strigomonas culicis]